MTEQPTTDEPTKAPDPNADAGKHATDQATEYGNDVFGWHELTFDDGTTLQVPPHPNLRQLDDDCLGAYDRLTVESKSYDREEISLPERTIKGDDGSEMVLPPETKPGDYVYPYHKGGVLVSPPFEVQEVQAAIGPEEYALLRSKTIKGRRANAGDVSRLWKEQGLRLMERQKSDSKSADSANSVAAVPAADSQ